jgi:pimeloyl-ACP methyl ester carboxylesterase
MATRLLLLDAGSRAPAGVRTLTADLHVPASPQAGAPLLFCVPGGGMTRKYLDLDVPGERGSYSMARWLAERHGCIVCVVDPPGVGDSDRPVDGYSLTPEAVSAMHAAALRHVLEILVQDGDPAPSCVVAVGHSAGAHLVVRQQAQHRSFDALCLLGFTGSGLASVLTADELRYDKDPDLLRTNLRRLVDARFGEPLPQGQPREDGFLVVGATNPLARHELARSFGPLLALVGLTSMIPGSLANELADIDVPVFIGNGEHDITGPIADLAQQLPSCPDLTLYTLAGAGHNHVVADNRHALWDRVGGWAIAQQPSVNRRRARPPARGPSSDTSRSSAASP